MASYLTSFFYVFREGSAVAAGSSVSGESKSSGCPKADKAVALSPSGIRKKIRRKRKTKEGKP